MEHKLTKRFRLVWDEKTKEIILNDEFSEGSVTYTRHACFEADTKEEIEAKIKELGLIEKKEPWE